MAQFDVHCLEGGLFVVDCQSDSLSHLATRVVAPLMRSGDVPAPSTRLHPVFEFRGETYLLATHLLTAMATRDLGRPVASLEAERYTIVAALDLVITGV
jgi:toxin CcdB